MKGPALFHDDVVFPGQFTSVIIDARTAHKLDALWRLEGFGCLEIVIVFPKDHAAPASPENAHTDAVLAEITLDRQSLGGERATLKIGESHRVRLETIVPTPPGYDKVADLPFAVVKGGANPNTDAIDDDTWDALRRRAQELLLRAPDLAANAPDTDPGHALPETLVDLDQAEFVAKWRLLYILADIFLDPEEERAGRFAFFEADDLGEALPVLEAAMSRLEGQTWTTASESVEAFLTYTLDTALARANDSLEACRLLSRDQAVTFPTGSVRSITKLQRDLDRVTKHLADILEEIADLHSQRDDEGDEVDP